MPEHLAYLRILHFCPEPPILEVLILHHLVGRPDRPYVEAPLLPAAIHLVPGDIADEIEEQFVIGNSIRVTHLLIQQIARQSYFVHPLPQHIQVIRGHPVPDLSGDIDVISIRATVLSGVGEAWGGMAACLPPDNLLGVDI